MSLHDKKEELESSEKRNISEEQAARFEQEKEGLEKRISPDDKRVSEELKREVELMKLDDNTKAEAEKKAEKIEFLGEKEKIEHLLEIAREKGIAYAIHVARKTNDPYLLDILHDTLAQEGFYKKIMNPTNDDNDEDTKKT